MLNLNLRGNKANLPILQTERLMIKMLKWIKKPKYLMKRKLNALNPTKYGIMEFQTLYS